MTNYHVSGPSLLVLRIGLSGIFIVAAINHLFNPVQVLTRLENAAGFWLVSSWTDPQLMISLSGVFMLIGGVLLLLGLFTRWVAMGLILILLPITLTVQIGHWATIGPLFKNVAIMGGLIFFAQNGAKCCALQTKIQSIIKS